MASPLLQPSPNLSNWGCHSPVGVNNIRDLLKERRNTASPLPPPSPALSDSGFSTFVDSPGTIHSPIFNFAQHHFVDEPCTPEQRQTDQFEDDEPSFDSNNDTTPSPPQPPRLGITTDLDEFVEPPRIGSPPIPASPSNNTETFSDCSPSPSIASVRMAKVAKIPHRRNYVPQDHSRLSAASSMLSGSIVANDQDEDEEEEEEDRFQDSTREEWTEGAIGQSSFVEDLPKDLAKIMASRDQSDGAKTPVPQFSSGRLPLLEVPCKVSPSPVPLLAGPSPIQKSDSHQSDLSDESWKEDLDAAVKHLESDPNLKPDADAMQRMKSILGPKLKMVSKAPWDSEFGDDEPLASALGPASNILPSRRSTDMLNKHASPAQNLPTAASKSGKERKENTKPAKSRARSFSVLTSRRNNNSTSPEEAKEREDALQGLGLGLGQTATLPDSPSKRSLKGLVKSYSGLPSSDSYHDLTSRAKSQLDFSSRRQGSSPTEDVAAPLVTIVSERQRIETGQLRKAGKAPPPVTFGLVSSSNQNIPRSAPPTVSTFARSESHASLIVRRPSPHTSTSMASLTTSSSPSTPNALIPAPPSPTSPDASRGSYFTAVPGGSSQSPTAPYSFGHHLISLEEARQRETENRRKMTPPSSRLPGHDSSTSLSSKIRTRESTLESVGTRKTSSTTPPALQSSNSSPATTVSSLPTPRSLRPKKSGFLKRMMGGTDKHERYEMPTPLPILDPSRISHQEEARTIMTSSASIPSLDSISAPSSLSKATGLRATPATASTNPSTLPSSSSRVAFGSTPTPDPNQRIRKGGYAAPSLSLRPVSMAFSAGLPSDFLANLAAAETANSNSNSEPVISPNAPSFRSTVSTTSTSVFDEAVLSPSALPITPLTPTFPLSPAASPAPNDDYSSKYLALSEEYNKAKVNWKSLQWELESQIRSLQIELEKTKEENQKAQKTSEFSESDKCAACGSSKVSTGSTSVSAVSSVISRPRFKGQGGTGTLFGSASGANL
ncbi:hypothetical protein JCM5350_008225 [Sporobolomyces pararoseus]